MSVTVRFRNKLFKKKNEFLDCCSYDSRTTNQYSEDNNRKKKNKIVSFTSVEIIDVESYKEYNKLDSPAELEMYEKNNSRKCDNCNCISFWNYQVLLGLIKVDFLLIFIKFFLITTSIDERMQYYNIKSKMTLVMKVFLFNLRNKYK